MRGRLLTTTSNLSRQGLDVLTALTNKRLERIWVGADEADKKKDLYLRDPGRWVKDQLNYELQYKQEAIMRSVAAGHDTAIRSGHKCGKSFVLAATHLWWLDIKGPDCRVISTAPGERQLKHVLWAEIGHLFGRWKKSRQFIKTKGMHIYHRQREDDWYALGVFSSEAGKIEGFHTKQPGKLLAVVDEGKSVERQFFEAVTSMHGQKLVASVPPLDGQGYFAEIFSKYRTIWKTIHMSALESPLIEEKWLRAREKDWIKGSAIWQAKIEGNIPRGDSSDLVITIIDVEHAQERWMIVNPGTTWRVGIGCDVARFGDDLTVRVSLRDPGEDSGFPKRVGNMVTTSGKDLMETVGGLREMAYREAQLLNPAVKDEEEIRAFARKIPIHVDDTGLGGGVTDRLSELEYNVVGVNFGASSRSELYADRGSEMWFDLAEDMPRMSLPPDHQFDEMAGRLVGDLCSRKYKYTSLCKKLEPKKDAKKRMGRSPDHGDALALANDAVRSGDTGAFGLDVW